ncbi:MULTISPECIES: hypothetical protein [unclassified Paraburkholderia]|uniref:hypothetical protein n=1 Tax=unclassified Paraburkholderia TaxID=2615204 RepID=UPI002AB1B9AF|nr:MULTISPECIES: hypothetical protein [unclassified Paraburkholderia]
MSSDLGTVFSESALAAIARHTNIPAAVSGLLAQSATRLMDSAMIIADPHTRFRQAETSNVKTALPAMPMSPVLEQAIEATRHGGFGPQAVRFFGLLGSLMLTLSGSQAQTESVAQWVAADMTGAFCMTDAGGPLASHWYSTAPLKAPGELVVDKIWAMNATRADFAIVVVRRGQSMILSPILIAPDVYRTAKRANTGAPFLDGALPLGNVALRAPFDADSAMSKGGPISAKIFLACARPWLIRALCAHVRWLAANGRVVLDEAAIERIGFLEKASLMQTACGHFDRFSEDQAMALKWIANETWVELLMRGSVTRATDQRDLLAFTKMEGSSYRCFLEIYERNRRARHAHA